MHRRGFLASAIAAGSGAVAGCAGIGGSQSRSAAYDIGMTASSFRPPEYEVAVGTTVVWQNTNSRAHTVTAYDDGLPAGARYYASGGFESETAAREAFWDHFGGAIPGNSGATFEHTFEVPGTYVYFCIPHEDGGMVGAVHVREEG